MASIEKDGIIFSNVKDRTVIRKGAGIITTSDNVSSGKYVYDIDSDPVVMALDIDWNGAKPGMGESANGITTTGELIKGVYSPVFAKAA